MKSKFVYNGVELCALSSVANREIKTGKEDKWEEE